MQFVAFFIALFFASCGRAQNESATLEPAAANHSAERAPRVGLWILCEGSQRILENPEHFPELLADAKALGATDLFVQVYRGGRAWFDSSFADTTPYVAMKNRNGFDPLQKLIDDAQAAGFRVHAWVNVFSLAQNRNAPILRAVGPQAVHVDRKGRSLLEYPAFEIPAPDREYLRMGTPGIYLDPAAPGVREHLLKTFAELIARYPKIDGVHFDYIRYPDVLPFAPGSRFGVGLDFGYGAATRARFHAETGLTAPFGDDSSNANRWDQWRRDQVTALVRETRKAAKPIHPTLQLSAAVWAYPDIGYLTLYQDWRTWLDQGWLDFAVPMLYSVDDTLLRHRVHEFASAPQSTQIWVGLGTYLFADNPSRAVVQIKLVRDARATGYALFSWDSIADAPKLKATLIREISQNAAARE